MFKTREKISFPRNLIETAVNLVGERNTIRTNEQSTNEDLIRLTRSAKGAHCSALQQFGQKGSHTCSF